MVNSTRRESEREGAPDTLAHTLPWCLRLRFQMCAHKRRSPAQRDHDEEPRPREGDGRAGGMKRGGCTLLVGPLCLSRELVLRLRWRLEESWWEGDRDGQGKVGEWGRTSTVRKQSKGECKQSKGECKQSKGECKQSKGECKEVAMLTLAITNHHKSARTTHMHTATTNNRDAPPPYPPSPPPRTIGICVTFSSSTTTFSSSSSSSSSIASPLSRD
jgi:hypothetical protein